MKSNYNSDLAVRIALQNQPKCATLKTPFRKSYGKKDKEKRARTKLLSIQRSNRDAFVFD
jgi:hypothetical protein